MSTILQIANADRNLSMLIKNLKAAEMENDLNGTGPFTIFAPINLAFRKSDFTELFENLVREGNKARLSDIINYHVISGKKMFRDFKDGQKLVTVNGQEVTINFKDGEVCINDAKILARDMQGTNGVLHSIDAVNFPQ